MSEYHERLDELGKKLKIRVKKCKKCGNFPFLNTLIDEQSWRDVYIKCQCGLEIPIDGGAKSIIEAWNEINDDKKPFTPVNKPYYVGKPSVCMHCLLRERCTECAKLNEKAKMEYVCGNFVFE